MQPANPHHNPDTCQVGVTPVQAFESDGVPIVPGMPLPPRHGRPEHRPVDETKPPPRNGTGETPEQQDSVPESEP
jgi:hypothetical protein